MYVDVSWSDRYRAIICILQAISLEWRWSQINRQIVRALLTASPPWETCKIVYTDSELDLDSDLDLDLNSRQRYVSRHLYCPRKNNTQKIIVLLYGIHICIYSKMKSVKLKARNCIENGLSGVDMLNVNEWHLRCCINFQNLNLNESNWISEYWYNSFISVNFSNFTIFTFELIMRPLLLWSSYRIILSFQFDWVLIAQTANTETIR